MSRNVAILIAVISLSLCAGVVIGQLNAPPPATAATATAASADTGILRSIDRKLSKLGAINSQLTKANAALGHASTLIESIDSRMTSLDTQIRSIGSHMTSLDTQTGSIATDLSQQGVLTRYGWGIAQILHNVCVGTGAITNAPTNLLCGP